MTQMNIITLDQDFCDFQPQPVRVPSKPRLRHRWVIKKTSPLTSRPVPSYIGDVRGTSHTASPSPLPPIRHSSTLRSQKSILGPSSGVKLSVSLHRLNQRKKRKVEELLRKQPVTSSSLKPELEVNNLSIQPMSLSKLTSSFEKYESRLRYLTEDRVVEGPIVIRQMDSEPRTRLLRYNTGKRQESSKALLNHTCTSKTLAREFLSEIR